MSTPSTHSLAKESGFATGNGGTNSVLICDDEPSIIDLFRSILSISIPGCAIDTASNGQEALDRFSEARHNVILMDLHMPVMDGQRAYHEIMRLCQQKGWKKPRFVFCTGYAPPAVIQEIVSTQGQHALLTKPTPMRVLVQTVKDRMD